MSRGLLWAAAFPLFSAFFPDVGNAADTKPQSVAAQLAGKSRGFEPSPISLGIGRPPSMGGVPGKKVR